MSGMELTEAIGTLISIGGIDTDAQAFCIDGAPYSKSRPRFSRNGRTYVPAKDREAEEATRLRLRRGHKLDGNVAMVCIFYRPNYQRIDVDNMLKHVCDAANGLLWEDDSQVTALLGIAQLDRERPRTIIAVAPHVSTLARGVARTEPCPVCGEPVTQFPSRLRVTCSRRCSSLIRGFEPLDDPVPCARCGKDFRRRTQSQRFCSPECRAEDLRGRPKHQSARSSCTECGKRLAHNRGGRCRDCWRANPRGAA